MKTVLVVDDDADIRNLITWKLGQAGYASYVACDGKEGLAAAIAGDAEGRAPDLILLDWSMPVMTGIELCHALRANPATDGIPVILLTANGKESEVACGFDAGADDYVLKPFSPRELLGRIHAVLSRSAVRA
jgi:DNA-binding response OmpR family regulator